MCCSCIVVCAMCVEVVLLCDVVLFCVVVCCVCVVVVLLCDVVLFCVVVVWEGGGRRGRSNLSLMSSTQEGRRIIFFCGLRLGSSYHAHHTPSTFTRHPHHNKTITHTFRHSTTTHTTYRDRWIHCWKKTQQTPCNSQNPKFVTAAKYYMTHDILKYSSVICLRCVRN